MNLNEVRTTIEVSIVVLTLLKTQITDYHEHSSLK